MEINSRSRWLWSMAICLRQIPALLLVPLNFGVRLRHVPVRNWYSPPEALSSCSIDTHRRRASKSILASFFCDYWRRDDLPRWQRRMAKLPCLWKRSNTFHSSEPLIACYAFPTCLVSTLGSVAVLSRASVSGMLERRLLSEGGWAGWMRMDLEGNSTDSSSSYGASHRRTTSWGTCTAFFRKFVPSSTSHQGMGIRKPRDDSLRGHRFFRRHRRVLLRTWALWGIEAAGISRQRSSYTLVFYTKISVSLILLQESSNVGAGPMDVLKETAVWIGVICYNLVQETPATIKN